jgi:purine-nucleoside phosphorylase
VLFKRHRVYDTYLLRKNKKIYPVIFNIIGAPIVVDLVSILHEGGCRNIIFAGYAYGGFKNLAVGNIVVPDKSYHFEGIYHPLRIGKEFSLPDSELVKKVKDMLKEQNIPFVEGTNISVSSVTVQPKHNNAIYKKIKPVCLEMEFAACLARAKEIGVRAAGIMIISDNKESSLIDVEKKKLRTKAKKDILQLIVQNLEKLTLPPLKNAKKFRLDEHMASIIDNDDDTAMNVYRKK